MYYHTHDSRHSPAGFPDWVFAGAGGVLFAELKGATEQLSPAQLAWFEMLRAARARVELWRPEDWHRGYIGAALRNIAGLGIARRDRLGAPPPAPCPRCGQPPGHCLPDERITHG